MLNKEYAMSDMTHVSAAEFQRAFGTLSDKAMKQPVAITKHGRDHLVLLSAEEYARLKRRDRRVFATDALTADEIAPFEGAKMDASHDHLDAELTPADLKALQP
jgi:prevent-host-death family protein